MAIIPLILRTFMGLSPGSRMNPGRDHGAEKSVKFTKQGEVVVDVAAASRTEDDIVLHVAVSDTGVGIPADKQRLIFEPFTQADGTTTRQYGGSGLGLAITAKLVQLMAGRLWVES